MYQATKGTFWWKGLKRGISDFVRRCIVTGEGRTPTSHWIIEIDLYSGMEVGTYHYRLCDRFASNRERGPYHLVCCGQTHKVSSFYSCEDEFSNEVCPNLHQESFISIVSDRDTHFMSYFFGRARNKLWEHNWVSVQPIILWLIASRKGRFRSLRVFCKHVCWAWDLGMSIAFGRFFLHQQFSINNQDDAVWNLVQ